MDDSYVGSILLFIAFVLFSAYFSASETAFTSLNQIRLKNEADLGDKKAKRALALQSQFDSLLSTILIGNNIVNIGASAIATVVLLAVS
ncbi:CNNM domain-containing protein [Facklamia hominis]|uniref:CNNM domain-containing protein n=1 Tax=Facklamia hominis TaxID=178214 RepID=UPI0029D41A5E|nr:CNNM domain-containing protein [Facklamia hominis]WPJ91304.1 CNNM domain-containing protein [Facklamia hominis]